MRNETFVMSQFGAQGESVFPIYQPDSLTLADDIFSTSARMTPDLMHIQHEYGLFGSQKGVAVIELIIRYCLANTPVVTTLHTVDEDMDREQEIILRHIVQDSAAVIVHEQFQKETLARRFDQADRIHVIEHGIREIQPVPDAKRKLELDGKKVIMLCGYFRPTKGFHRVLDFLPAICAQDNDVVLVVAGKIRGFEAQRYQQDLFTQLNESPVADRIVFLRGQFPQHTFDTILSAADIVVLPYERGAQSGMMAQCFALGRPVVASDLQAFRLLIERSGGGVVCRTDDEYIDAILQILNDDQYRSTMQESIRNYVDNRAGWSYVADRHVDVYQRVVTVPYGKGRYVYFHDDQ
jgi:glycosyltransferase involved in cell wall biosynthesis